MRLELKVRLVECGFRRLNQVIKEVENDLRKGG